MKRVFGYEFYKMENVSKFNIDKPKCKLQNTKCKKTIMLHCICCIMNENIVQFVHMNIM